MSSNNYSDKYQHNEALVDYLHQNSNFADWEIVALFYASLHYINLFLSSQYKIDVEKLSSHQKRNRYIDENCPQQISQKYNTLYDLSRTARYQYIDMSAQLNYAHSCYKNLKKECGNYVLSKSKHS